ncbi:hypothetical protein [uncultured Paracoccus sp.]|uniref:hypothetical protein n=1 Tax=uncultured Paracoccus sp. TaxID=189685 RepID=UPI00261BBDFB|nr:hypothetical protein [uncultured Paracoccus sp.]
MTIDQAWSHAITWLRRAILIALLALISVWLLARFGVRLPVATPDHVSMAYVAGAFWLVSKA